MSTHGETILPTSGAEPFQVQFEDVALAAVKVQLRAGGELVGEATVLTFVPPTYLLATMSWIPAGEEPDADAQKRRVCASLVQEATDLADLHGAELIAMAGSPEDLIARGFERNGSMWIHAPAKAV